MENIQKSSLYVVDTYFRTICAKFHYNLNIITRVIALRKSGTFWRFTLKIDSCNDFVMIFEFFRKYKEGILLVIILSTQILLEFINLAQPYWVISLGVSYVKIWQIDRSLKRALYNKILKQKNVQNVTHIIWNVYSKTSVQVDRQKFFKQ